jgi:hypothetical protein
VLCFRQAHHLDPITLCFRQTHHLDRSTTVMLCFRQTHHLYRSCCVFDRHIIISTDLVVFSTDTSPVGNNICETSPTPDWARTKRHVMRAIWHVIFVSVLAQSGVGKCCFPHGTHHLDRSCCVVISTDTPRCCDHHALAYRMPNAL